MAATGSAAADSTVMASAVVGLPEGTGIGMEDLADMERTADMGGTEETTAIMAAPMATATIRCGCSVPERCVGSAEHSAISSAGATVS
jgi:hypothetical protein